MGGDELLHLPERCHDALDLLPGGALDLPQPRPLPGALGPVAPSSLLPSLLRARNCPDEQPNRTDPTPTSASTGAAAPTPPRPTAPPPPANAATATTSTTITRRSRT